MYAVIETGGKQYRVEVGTELEVELLDAAAGDVLTLERVLLVADGDTAAIGQPVVSNATVSARVLGRDRGEKVISFKYRPKARRRVKKGHRQELTLLRIDDIVLDGHSAAADVVQAEQARARDRAKLEEAARRQAAADAELAAKLAAEKPVPPKPAATATVKSPAKGAAKSAAKIKSAATIEKKTEKKTPARAEAKPAPEAEVKTSAKRETKTKAAPAKSPAKRSAKKES